MCSFSWISLVANIVIMERITRPRPICSRAPLRQKARLPFFYGGCRHCREIYLLSFRENELSFVVEGQKTIRGMIYRKLLKLGSAITKGRHLGNSTGCGGGR